MGRINKSGKTFNKNTYSYYKRLYSANYSYYKKRGYELPPMKLTESQWKETVASGYTNSEIIYGQFHKYSKESIRNLKQIFKEEGQNVSERYLARGNFTQAEWQIIQNRYRLARGLGLAAWEANIFAFGSE